MHQKPSHAQLSTTATAFCSSPRFVEHDTGPSHPERPDRIRAVHRAVREAGLIVSPDPFPDFQFTTGLARLNLPPLLELSPEPATEADLLRVHPQAYIDRVKHLTRHSGILDQGDTPTEPRSYATALLAAGAGLVAVDAVLTGKARRVFVAARPPGHHAEPLLPMGFCLFSNIAIAVKHAQQKYGVEKIAIVDFDVHHGNGTQAAFEDDPSVLFISLHQHPSTCYPGSGHAYETGVGPGAGATLNIPFQPGSDDLDYVAAFDAKVIPAIDRFKPQLLMISAGFDAHRDDPLAQMNLSDECYEQMTRLLVDVANQHCQGRIVSLLEGGYNLHALGRSAVRHLVGLIG